VLKKIINTIFIIPVKIYQWTISPLLGSNCRHSPTCSEYTILSIKEWGGFRGIWLGIKRMSRCHPWGRTGYDPVPMKEDNFKSDNINTK